MGGGKESDRKRQRVEEREKERKVTIERKGDREGDGIE